MFKLIFVSFLISFYQTKKGDNLLLKFSDVLNQSSENFHSINPIESKKCAELSTIISKKIGYTKGECLGRFNQANCLYVLSKYKESILVINQLNEHKSYNQTIKLKSNILLGKSYKKLKRYNEAIKVFEDTYKSYESS